MPASTLAAPGDRAADRVVRAVDLDAAVALSLIVPVMSSPEMLPSTRLCWACPGARCRRWAGCSAPAATVPPIVLFDPRQQ